MRATTEAMAGPGSRSRPSAEEVARGTDQPADQRPPAPPAQEAAPAARPPGGHDQPARAPAAVAAEPPARRGLELQQVQTVVKQETLDTEVEPKASVVEKETNEYEMPQPSPEREFQPSWGGSPVHDPSPSADPVRAEQEEEKPDDQRPHKDSTPGRQAMLKASESSHRLVTLKANESSHKKRGSAWDNQSEVSACTSHSTPRTRRRREEAPKQLYARLEAGSYRNCKPMFYDLDHTEHDRDWGYKHPSLEKSKLIMPSLLLIADLCHGRGDEKNQEFVDPTRRAWYGFDGLCSYVKRRQEFSTMDEEEVWNALKFMPLSRAIAEDGKIFLRGIDDFSLLHDLPEICAYGAFQYSSTRVPKFAVVFCQSIVSGI